MGDSGMKGTAIDQDRRFSDKESKLLRTTKFPAVFSTKVDMRKVNLNVMRPWMVKEITRLVGFEDEVVVEYAMGLLEDPTNTFPDPRKIQISLTGFLEAKTPEFTLTLWELLISAQTALGGIPPQFIEEKKEELRKKEEAERSAGRAPPTSASLSLSDEVAFLPKAALALAPWKEALAFASDASSTWRRPRPVALALKVACPEERPQCDPSEAGREE